MIVGIVMDRSSSGLARPLAVSWLEEQSKRNAKDEN